MKIVLAPDSFKGSASAAALCQAMAAGIRSAVPDAEIVQLPMADGGEGTMDNLVYATSGRIIEAPTTDPLGRPIIGRYGVLGDDVTVVVELAEASGLTRLDRHERDPLRASTYGTGLLLRHALASGYRSFIVGLGGSATNDGGAGMLQALGLRLSDASGEELAPGGARLAELASIDGSGWDARILESRFVIASDVRNPLLGPEGASCVFGPQKGADAAMVQELDDALRQFAAKLHDWTGIDVASAPGGGAAGGAGAALLACFGAEMRSGAQLVMEALRFKERLAGADWVVTGEGRLDAQTESGKVISAICDAAGDAQVPVIALCGSIDPAPGLARRMGLTAAFSITPGPCSLEEAIMNAEAWAEAKTEHLFRLIAAAQA
jgi:glycerate 2-kinase